MNEKFDIIIVGSGMGGLICGNILSKEGYKVLILEKNKQFGGCLQTYVRDKVIFDSGVHYLGGLSKGQNLYQIFKYLGIIDKLKLQKMDEDVFDKIIFDDDKNEYPFAQGYENFIQKLLIYFPKEEKALRQYCDKIKEVCSKFPLYNLRSGGDINEKTSVLEIDTKTYIESITSNKKLQAVLVGNSMLYVLQPNKTPFYVHAMIMNSYIESSYKCIDGGSNIGKYLVENIRKNGGDIRRNSCVKKILVNDGKASGIMLSDGKEINADYIISNMHPVQTLEITQTDMIKNAYRHRVENLENSIGGFVVNIVFKKDTFSYKKPNYYWQKNGQMWNTVNHTDEDWPLTYSVFFSASSKTTDYAESMTILTYMRYNEVKKWENTFNTTSQENERAADYQQFKKQKTEKLISLVEEKFPNLRTSIKTYYTATPLTYKDYMGTSDGSMYGIAKDYNNPLKTFISPRTKVSNLFLTGQNLNLHGILGAAMSGLVTCVAFLEKEEIIDKIRNA